MKTKHKWLFILSLAGAFGLSLLYIFAPPAEIIPALLLECGQNTLCAVAAAVLACTGGVPLFPPHKPTRLGVAAILCTAAVALNNFPWEALFSGTLRVSAPVVAVFLFALVCLSTAVLEELLFRGFLLPLCASRMPGGRRGQFGAVLLSSAVFSLAHLLNLATGAGVGATLLQVGYSFLVGCAAAVLFLVSGTLAAPILFHAVYNFGGRLFYRLGEGVTFGIPTVALTAALVTVSAVLLFFTLFCGAGDRTAARFFSQKG